MLLKELLSEKWNKKVTVSPSEKGKYSNKSVSELKSEYERLKKSGPHKKGSPEYEKMRELAFAIRAKTGWGKVSEDFEFDIDEFISEYYELGGEADDLDEIDIYDLFTLYEKAKPSAGLTKKERSEIVKKAKRGEDLGKPGKGFEKVVKAAKKAGMKNPEAVAAAQMWKQEAAKKK